MVRLGIVVMAVALAGCSSSSDPGPGSASPTSAATHSEGSSPAATADVDPEVQQLLALSPGDQEAQLATLTAEIERGLMTSSGLEATLGGPAAADKAFAALTSLIVTRASAFRGNPSSGRFGAGVRSADEVSVGGLLFAGWMIAGIGADGIVGSTNDAKPGKPQSETRKDGQSVVELTGSADKAGLDTTTTATVDGVTGTLHVRIDISPCPDATGTFTSKILIEASATSAGGRTGSNLSQQVDVVGRVGDDAELAGYDVTTRSQAAKFASSKGSYVDVTNTTSWAGGHVTAAARTLNRAGGTATSEQALQWANAGTLTEALVNHYALDAAEKAWKSGRCVDLRVSTDPSKRSGLKPSTPVSLTAAPRSRIDGSPAGGSVRATLTGGTSIDPADTAVPADATYSYVAPGEKDKTATVTLESRSKRGIGRATVTFDTTSAGYFVRPTNGGSIAVKGFGSYLHLNMAALTPTDVCDVTGAFTLTGPLATTQTFTPTGQGRGTTTYSTSGTGIPMSGAGTYVVDLGAATLTAALKGTIRFPGKTVGFTATQVFKLDAAQGTCQ
jgi:hypothetical protein